jgi:HSP20 family protein
MKLARLLWRLAGFIVGCDNGRSTLGNSGRGAIMVSSFRATGEEDFSSVARQMGKWVNHVLGGQGYGKYSPGQGWAPPSNFYEDATRYCVVVDLAGVATDAIDLRVEEGALILSGERETPEMPDEVGETKVHMMEIDHGRFCRKLDLPVDVDIDATVDLAASYRNGMLWIFLPKRSPK